MPLTMTIEGVETTVLSGLTLLQLDLEAAGNTAAQAGAKAGAEYARQHHKFKTRSGKLESSIGWRALVKDGPSPLSEFFADAAHALYVEEDTKPHPIDPKPGNRTGMMWWNDPWPDGPLVHATHVNHPGTTGEHFMATAARAADATTQVILEVGVDVACAKASHFLR